SLRHLHFAPELSDRRPRSCVIICVGGRKGADAKIAARGGAMKKSGLAVVVAVFAVVLALAQPVMAADQFGARLRGLEEVPSISTLGQGFFLGTLNAAGTALDYTVVYFDLQGTVTQSHIHIGQPGVNGGIVLFFCTNLAPP